jgi:preprotein translocase subunit YajC
MLFEAPAFAQVADPAAAGNPLLSLLPFVLIMVIFYFLLIRPQQKRQKEHKNMLEALKRNDMVVTYGGIIGKVLKVEEKEIQLEIADGVKVRVVKSMVADLRTKMEDTPAPANKAD